MKVAVRYFSKGGNTEKLARAIGDELQVSAETVDVPLSERVDMLFLCNSVYYAGMNAHVKNFVKDNASRIGKIVNVSTAALIDSTCKQMCSVAKVAGVAVSPDEYHCRGSFSALHAGHPDARDVEAARQFAHGVIARAS